MKLHLGELRRRGVFRTLAAYAVASWVLVEVSSTIAPAFRLPEWTVAVLTTVLVLGAFPALIVAWRYEFTNKGVTRDDSSIPDDLDRSARLLGTMFLLVLVAVTALLWVNYFRAHSESAFQSITDSQVGAPEVGEDGQIRSIAVLPFLDLSLTQKSALLGDGIAEAILHILAQNKKLTVIARTSSFYFRDKDLTAAQIGRVLAVQALLEGSVQLVGDRLKVTSQLIRTSDQSHIWSEVYEAPLDEIFALQEQIAQSVHDRVLAKEPADEPSVSKTDYPSVESYQLVLQARQSLEDFGLAATEEAIRLLRLAIELSPDYADAHVWLSAAFSKKYDILDSRGAAWSDLQNVRDEERAATELALELDPNNAMAILQQGNHSQGGGSGKEFDQARTRALELAPNNPQVLVWVSLSASQELDLKSSRELIARARAVDPSDFGVFRQHVSWLCFNQPVVPLVEAQISTYNASAAETQSALAYAYWCDDRFAEYAKAMILLMRIEQDSAAATQFLIELAELGHPGALRQISKLHVMLPRIFNYVYHDESVFFDDVVSDRLAAYGWHRGNDTFHPYFLPISFALLQIQQGDYDGARSSLDLAQGVWEEYLAYKGERYYWRETLAIYAYQTWLLAQAGDEAESRSTAQQLLQVVDSKRLTDWSLTLGYMNDVPLLILLLNDQTARAVQWLRDAERFRWDYFQIILSSPIYAGFRQNREVIDILDRMANRRQQKLAEMDSVGAPEILDASLLMEEVERRVPISHYHRAVSALALGRDFQATAYFLEQALLEDPSDSATLRFASRFCVRIGRLDDAITLSKHSIQLDPGNAGRYISLGYAYLFAGRLDEALASFEKALQLRSDQPSARAWIAITQVLLGDSDSALLAIEAEPFEASRLMGEAIVHHALGNETSAKNAVQELIDNHATRFAFQIAYVWAFLGEKDAAFEWLQVHLQRESLVRSSIVSNPLFANRGESALANLFAGGGNRACAS